MLPEVGASTASVSNDGGVVAGVGRERRVGHGHRACLADAFGCVAAQSSTWLFVGAAPALPSVAGLLPLSVAGLPARAPRRAAVRMLSFEPGPRSKHDACNYDTLVLYI